MAENEMILERAIEWMAARGWKRRVAKRRQYEQSLFEHTLVELDVALQFLPILRQPCHFDLSPEEERVLLVSLVAHDVGKEKLDWQEYIFGRRPFVSDVDPALTRDVLPELCAVFGLGGLDEQVMAVIENCVSLHMRHERHDSNVVLAVLQGTSRWYTLANLVYHIDNTCSAKGVFEAKAALEHSLLGKHLKVAYHQVAIRGVSTTALHRAALEAFEEAGWTPLLHFSDASLYACSATQPGEVPTRSRIEHLLALVLDEASAREVKQIMVGSSTASILPKPELFDYREADEYLRIAAGKVHRTSFGKVPLDDFNGRKGRRRTIADYRRLKGVEEPLDARIIERETERISSAYPEIEVLCFFKAMMSSNLVGKAGEEIARLEYEKIFGEGTWRLNKPQRDNARHMAYAVDRFWGLPGSQFHLNITTVEELAPEMRTKLLIDILSDIAQKVYAAIPLPPSRAALSRKMAAAFVEDLIAPIVCDDIVQKARQQLEHYAASKPFTGKKSRQAVYMCPICNSPFEEGTQAVADIVASPESHTNRGVAHGAFDSVTICDACKYERILRQLLLGEQAADLIIIFPRMNIGPSAGEHLVRRARALYERAHLYMLGDSDDPDRRLWLAGTHLFANRTLEQDLDRLTPDQLVDLLTYRRGEEARKKNRREMAKALREEYSDDLTLANDIWGTNFASWEEAVDAVDANKVTDQTARQIRARACKLRPRMRLVCQTPHLIMLPVTEATKLDEDSETNAALRRTFVALLLGLSLDASVAIVRDSDQIDFQGGEGVAYVPPVPAARELVGSNWVSIAEAERWVRRIALASILSSDGKYSERSGLLQVLTAPTAGHILRRIEQKRAEAKLSLEAKDITHLRLFEEVMWS